MDSFSRDTTATPDDGEPDFSPDFSPFEFARYLFSEPRHFWRLAREPSFRDVSGPYHRRALLALALGRSYPIENASDLHNAIQAPRAAPAPRSRIRAWRSWDQEATTHG